jgi:hypothetical protein
MSHAPTPCCPNCGAPLGEPPAERCAACGWRGDSVVRITDDVNPYADDVVNPYAPPRALIEASPVFHIGGLMGLIAVIAALTAVTVMEPFTGGFLWIVTVPALIRTSTGLRRRYGDERATLGRIAWLFTTSFALSTLTVVSAFIAFCATCFPVGLMTMRTTGGAGLVLACLVGLMAGGLVIWALARSLWPVKGRFGFDRGREIVFLDEPASYDKRGNRLA